MQRKNFTALTVLLFCCTWALGSLSQSFEAPTSIDGINIPKNQTFKLESIIDSNDMIALTKQEIANNISVNLLPQRSSATARMEFAKSNSKSQFCTGSLFKDNILITNAHCAPQTSSLNFIRVLFSHRHDSASSSRSLFRLNPESIKEKNVELDYLIIESNQEMNALYGYIPFLMSDTLQGVSGAMIHHPNGDPQYLSKNCEIVTERASAPNTVFHTCDTKPGSSGSILFDQLKGTLIALHYAGSATNDGYNYANAFSAILKTSNILKKAFEVPIQPVETLPLIKFNRTPSENSNVIEPATHSIKNRQKVTVCQTGNAYCEPRQGGIDLPGIIGRSCDCPNGLKGVWSYEVR